MSKAQIKKGLLWFTGIGVILIVVSYLLTFLYPYINWLFSYIFYGILYLFALILSPILHFVDGVELEPPEVEPFESAEIGNPLEYEETGQMDAWMTIFEGLAIALTVVVAIVALVLFYRYRKRLNESNKEKKEQNVSPISQKAHVSEPKIFKRKEKKEPKNKVRKAYFSFEKWAERQGIGRYESETIEEWLDRLQLKYTIPNDFIDHYKNVRYGRDDGGHETFEAAIKRVKQNIIEEKNKRADHNS